MRKAVKTALRYLLFGDMITMDHIEATGRNLGIRGLAWALVIYDLATGFRVAYPCKNKDGETTTLLFKQFLGRQKVKAGYVDNADELEVAMRACGVIPDKSRAGRSQNNAVIERQNQEANRGAKVALLQAGLPPPFWASCHAVCLSC